MRVGRTHGRPAADSHAARYAVKQPTARNVRWNYFTMNTPQVVQAISGKRFAREQAKATVQGNDMLDEFWATYV
jgi:hypothetical protein